MARYVDVDKFKHSLELSIESWSRDFNSKAPTIKTTYQEVLHRLENMKTADVVEVVRCKDCKWFSVHNKDGCYRPDLDHHAQMTPVYENDFCSYGTPKERGGEK